MKTFLILAVFVVVVKSSHAKAKEEKAFDDQAVDDIITKMTKHDERPAVSLAKRASQAECNKNLKFPESSNIQITDNSNKTLITFNQNHIPCRPRPFPVNMPAPFYINAFPTMTKLYRCYGAALTRHQECTATKKEKISVQYMDLTDFSFHTVMMFNHTKCETECIVKESHCNPKTQTYLPHRCECGCKLKKESCDSTRYLDADKCMCQCKIKQKCDVYQEWDPVGCKCVCDKCVRDMCSKHNKILNEQHCTCT